MNCQGTGPRHSPHASWQVAVTQKPSPQSRSFRQFFRWQAPEMQSKVSGHRAVALHALGWQSLFTQVVPVPQGLLTLQPATQSVSPEQAQWRGSQISVAPHCESLAQVLGKLLHAPQPVGVPGGAH